eukprot:940456-Rhodomonas_salina.1
MYQGTRVLLVVVGGNPSPSIPWRSLLLIVSRDTNRERHGSRTTDPTHLPFDPEPYALAPKPWTRTLRLYPSLSP